MRYYTIYLNVQIRVNGPVVKAPNIIQKKKKKCSYFSI